MIDVGKLFEQYAPRVRAVVSSKMARADQDDVDDVVQNTFERLVKVAHQYEERGSGPMGWISVIAAREVSEYYKRRTRACRSSPDAPTTHLSEGIVQIPAPLGDLDDDRDDEDLLRQMRLAMTKINPVYRDAIEARLTTGRMYKDLAREQGVTTQTFASRIRKGCQRIQRELGITA